MILKSKMKQIGILNKNKKTFHSAGFINICADLFLYNVFIEIDFFFVCSYNSGESLRLHLYCDILYE